MAAGYSSDRDQVVSDLVIANHILHARAIVDGFGHVSARHPDTPDRFLLSRNRAPALVEAADILEYDLDGEPTDPDHPPVYLERFIHAAIFRARPEVGAVVHSHARSVIPFATAKGASLQPLSHMASFLGEGCPCYEIRDSVGPASDLLIRDNRLADDLAGVMGDAPVVLMRGHGYTAVGRDVRQAVFRAVYTEWNAGIQMDTMKLGEPIFMTPEEAAASAAANDSQITRAWDYWAREAETAHPAPGSS
ncbi:class II aldolase/adducin family protein [Amorphus sp. MBR-141]